VSVAQRPAAQAETLAARLAAARARVFVGRAAELDLFRSALSEQPPPFAVLYLHGPGGIGKSALLHRLADEAEHAGWATASVSCRVGGHPATFLPAVAAALDLPDDADPLAALPDLARTVLLLDTYEAADGLDGWLRDVFLPRLPAGVLVVIGSRHPPSAEWRADPSWHELLRVVALRNLPPDDARALLAARGMAAEAHEPLLRLAGGHPLALVLLADLAAQGGHTPRTHEDVPDVVAALVERFLSEAPSPVHREALEVCAHALFTTEPLLRAVMPGADAAGLHAWLRGLSFVEQHPEGLAPHDLAREAIEADLRLRDPDRYRDLRAQVQAYVVAQLLTTRGRDQERALRQGQHLHRGNPLFRPYVTWSGTDAVRVRGLRAGDVEQIVALGAELQGPAEAAVTALWADRQPEAFWIFERPGEPAISGYAALLDLAQPAADELAADSVVASAFRWMRQRAPLRPGEHVLLLRMIVFRHAYGLPCPEFDLVQTRSTLRWLNAPHLAWSFIAIPEEFVAFWEPQMHYIDMPRAVGAESRVADRTWHLFARDWRASPAAAWLALLAERELDFDLDPAQLAADRPPALVVLSQPEFAEAVRAALRAVRDPRALAASLLARSRVVVERAGEDDRGEALADLLADAVDALRGSEHGDKLHRAVATTFFKGAPTQEVAAERLGLPFSTYRRHLAAGVEAVITWLWERELHGAPAQPGVCRLGGC
jgi:hypothetical protein